MRWLTRVLPRLAVVAIATATLAYAAVPVLRHAGGIIAIEVPVPAPPVGERSAPKTDLTAIFERAPFGRAAPPDANGAPGDNSLPAFALRGVFLAHGARSAALIDVDGETALFRETQVVTGDLKLAEVLIDQVTLLGGGRTLTLWLDDTSLPTPEDDNAEPAPATTPEDLIARLGGDLVVPARYEKPKPPETTSEYIDYWRKRIQKNPRAVLEEIGLRPSDAGYVIADRHDMGVRLAGLKPGDLVRSVNGQAVGDPDKDRPFYDRIAASGLARLEVERNGRVLTFSFPLR